MANFSGTLTRNEIYYALYNMIISQVMMNNDLSGLDNSLAETFKEEGGLLGDTKLIYSADTIGSQEWLGDNEAQNLLKIHRPKDPVVQEVKIDQFRMIPITIDNYLSKRGFSTEGVYHDFTSVMLDSIGQSKKIYDNGLINTFVGTTESKSTKAKVEIDVTTSVGSTTGEEKNRLRAQTIAKGLSDLLFDIKDCSRDFNDNKHYRAYNPNDLIVVWNQRYISEITKLDLPTIFHKDGLLENKDFVLPQRFFGDIVTAAAGVTSDGTYCSLVEADYAKAVGDVVTHLYPGDVIPAGYYLVTEVNETKTSTSKYRLTDTIIAKTVKTKLSAGEAYKPNNKVICKILHKNSIPFMSAFETSQTFFNPRSLTESHYLIWGFSTPTYNADKPFITVVEK